MKKADFILIGLLLIIFIHLIIFAVRGKSGNKAEVIIDGNIKETLDLNKDGIHIYESEYGFNVVEIKDSKIHVIEADCPGHDCINKGFIHRNNEVIVCIPHKFEVKIISDADEFDAYTQ